MMELNQHHNVVHLVCTRFNLAIHFECDKRLDSNMPEKAPWLDEEYLEIRFALFEKYTFYSLKNQSNMNFIWLVMFHQDTPEKYKKRIKKYQTEMTQFVPLYFSSEESGKVSEIIKSYIRTNYEGYHVITTRIDNDDLVHKTFIEEIQGDTYQPKEGIGFLSYVNGLQYDQRNKQLLNFIYPHNHFISFFADTKNLGSHILQYNHAYIDQEDIEVVYKETQIPLWVEVIHENNFSNALHWRFSTVRVPYSIKEEYRCIDLQWNFRAQWMLCMVIGIGKVFWNRGKGLYRIMLRKK